MQLPEEVDKRSLEPLPCCRQHVPTALVEDRGARGRAPEAENLKLVIERQVRDEDIGHRLVRQMERKHVSAIVARRKGTPGAANDVLKKLRILLRFAIDNGMRKDDPTLRIKSFAEGTFHT